MTLPCLITLLRIALTVLFAGAYSKGNILLALMLFIVACASDVADGYIARRFNMVSDMGKLLDPVADKLMIFAGIWCLVQSNIISRYWLLLVAGVEAAFIIGGAYFLLKGIVVHSKNYGKAASIFFAAGIGFGIVGMSALAVGFLISAIICVLSSMGYYVLYFGK